MAWIVAEVLEPGTLDAEAFERVGEYILLIEPNAPVVMQWLPDEDRSWQMRLVDGPG
jgi:hypothetical protein